MKFSDFTDEEVKKLANDIENLSEKGDDKIYEAIGNGLYDSGYIVSTTGSSIIQPIHESNGKFNLLKSFDFALDTTSLTTTQAIENGKSFMQRFKDQLQKTICTNADIQNLVTGKGTLDQWLRIGIPLVLAALGIGTLSPIMLVVIAAVFALIIQVGLEVYCDAYWSPSSPPAQTQTRG